MTLQLHRPDGEGGLEPQTETPKDWRDQLASPRWNPASLKNTEMNPTRTSVADGPEPAPGPPEPAPGSRRPPLRDGDPAVSP
jgi:hypothetical protein